MPLLPCLLGVRASGSLSTLDVNARECPRELQELLNLRGTNALRPRGATILYERNDAGGGGAFTPPVLIYLRRLPLGRGGDGDTAGIEVCVKRTLITHFVGRAVREARLQVQLSHPHLLPALASIRGRHHYYLVLPAAEGDLWAEAEAMRAQGGGYTEEELRDVARQLLSGLEHLHAEGLAHRDVKPANALRMPDGRVVVADLGCADAHNAGFVAAGTTQFQPPECRRRRGPSALAVLPKGYDQRRQDMWGVGATLASLWFAALPNVQGKGPAQGPRDAAAQGGNGGEGGQGAGGEPGACPGRAGAALEGGQQSAGGAAAGRGGGPAHAASPELAPELTSGLAADSVTAGLTFHSARPTFSGEAGPDQELPDGEEPVGGGEEENPAEGAGASDGGAGASASGGVADPPLPALLAAAGFSHCATTVGACGQPMSAALLDLLRQLLAPRSVDRPTSSQALAHTWLAPGPASPPRSSGRAAGSAASSAGGAAAGSAGGAVAPASALPPRLLVPPTPAKPLPPALVSPSGRAPEGVLASPGSTIARVEPRDARLLATFLSQHGRSTSPGTESAKPDLGRLMPTRGPGAHSGPVPAGMLVTNPLAQGRTEGSECQARRATHAGDDEGETGGGMPARRPALGSDSSTAPAQGSGATGSQTTGIGRGGSAAGAGIGQGPAHVGPAEERQGIGHGHGTPPLEASTSRGGGHSRWRRPAAAAQPGSRKRLTLNALRVLTSAFGSN
ncbi:hypothetical protein HYH03_005978 [Edaphochlamys debaryana]|uniref:Protein kinase domain-containing protein n=1 Tax=Edaphochlamys debaryana TaxID=47281 RepID=A0A836C202_9CHLO|nr:hypothetical protein HYH03_005978 [Edaphochlamys debaryana]|eukprot:KAG2496059.1 hypothetical protein HYH03_005978 [Edaphochlamys debaryana]